MNILERILSAFSVRFGADNPEGPAIALTPRHERWRLMTRTQLSLPNDDSTRNKVRDILDRWLISKWAALADEPGLLHGNFKRGDVDQFLRIEDDSKRGAWFAELTQRERGTRVWVTAVSIHPEDGQLCVQVQNGCYTRPSERLDPNTPLFLRRIATELGARDGTFPVTGLVHHIDSDDSFDDLVECLTSRKRKFPVVVLSPVRGRETPSVDASALAKRLFGVAHVVTLSQDDARQLWDYAGRDLAVPQGGARIYMPGFTVNADDEDHPKCFVPAAVTRGEVETHDGIAKFILSFAFRHLAQAQPALGTAPETARLECAA